MSNNPYYSRSPVSYASPQPPGYPFTGHGGRPGLVTAIGYASIFVASLSILGSGYSALQGLVMFQVARITSTLSSSSSSAFNAPIQGVAASRVFAKAATHVLPEQGAVDLSPPVAGMTAADRAAAATVLESLESLTPEQHRQLDAILARAGKEIFLVEATGDQEVTSPMSSSALASAVKSHGTVPSPSDSETDPVFYETLTGHLELHDDRAIFRPRDTGNPAIRISATEPIKEPGPSEAVAVPATAPVEDDPFANPTAPASAPSVADPSVTSLSSGEVHTILTQVQTACGNMLKPVQIASLQAALEAQDQQLVTPGTLSPVNIAQMQPDGGAFIRFNRAFVFIDPRGIVTNQSPATFSKTTTNPMAVALSAGEALMSLGLAIYLLVSGIFVLKQSPRGRLLHQVYAMIKLPLAVVAVAGVFWMLTDMLQNMVPGGAKPGLNGFVLFNMILSAAGIVYPIVLLITLQSKTVKEYYRTTLAQG